MDIDVEARPWSPDSWRDKTALQQPDYPDDVALEDVLRELGTLPPLVTSWEIETLKKQLAEAAAGRRFVLQGGDCAESFDECTASTIVNRLKIMLQMSLVLVYGLKKHVIRIGRFGGQYAKPRSEPFEVRNGTSLPAYRGDIINGPDFTPESRIPDPQRMLRAYSQSGLSLNFIRALAEGGFADLHHPENWDLDFVSHSPLEAEYHGMVGAIRDALRFTDSIAETPSTELKRVQFFTSHEALHLAYEQSLTRPVRRQNKIYNLSTHFPWIGVRTAQIDGAHVEYFRGIANPIGIKVGPNTTPAQVQDLLRVLDPQDEPGRITLIHRFGAKQIADRLPPLIRAVRSSGKCVLWICDPMHGNTESTATGIKTRRFEHILAELEQAMEVHTAEGSHMGGVHFELTGDNVTECTGGARGLSDADLEHAYRSHVDPRLNAEQALEMALSIVHKHQRMQG